MLRVFPLSPVPDLRTFFITGRANTSIIPLDTRLARRTSSNPATSILPITKTGSGVRFYHQVAPCNVTTGRLRCFPLQGISHQSLPTLPSSGSNPAAANAAATAATTSKNGGGGAGGIVRGISSSFRRRPLSLRLNGRWMHMSSSRSESQAAASAQPLEGEV